MIRSSVGMLAVAAAIALPTSGAQAWSLKTLYNFCTQANCADGNSPLAGLVQDASGTLYGTTEVGGAHDAGVVFRLARKGKNWTYSVLYDFCSSCGGGAFPVSRLIIDTAGRLYGTVQADGELPDCGFAFRLSPRKGRWKLENLHSFCADEQDGRQPMTGLTYQGMNSGAPYDGASPLYGVTPSGGATDRGTVFELSPKGNKWKERVLYAFCPVQGCTDGWQPSGDLAIDSAGNLYGMTILGGSFNIGAGVVYELSPGAPGETWSERVLHSFCAEEECTDGQQASGAVALDSKRHLFGTTQADRGEGGTVFRLDLNSLDEKVIHTFCSVDGCADGYLPAGGVTIDASGTVFGANELGGGDGGSGSGTIFRVKDKKFETLYSFCTEQNCADGRIPAAPVIAGTDGHLFGTTSQGGPESAAGTVFELVP